MRLFTKNVVVLAVAAVVALAGAGCEKSRDELRPDVDTVVSGDHGPQCRDLREMASRLAPQLLACDDIKANQFRVTVVMKDMANETEDMRGRDMNIYVAALTGLLNTPQTKDRILFVEQRAVTESLQASEGPRGGTAVDTRIIPQYALYGTVYWQVYGRTSYYLFQFHLTNLTTGGQSWSGQYEVRSLNYQ